jgi:hypothetical protein
MLPVSPLVALPLLTLFRLFCYSRATHFELFRANQIESKECKERHVLQLFIKAISVRTVIIESNESAVSI